MNCSEQNNLQNLTGNALLMIEEMAATGFTPNEIAEVLEVDETSFLSAFNSPGHVVRKCYRKGYLQGQLKLRQRIALDAAHGSSPAQTLLKKIYDECDYQLKQV